MELYIAEKPSFGKALADVFGVSKTGDGYIECGNKTITWAFGHLYTYHDPDSYTPDDVPRNKKGGKVWRVDELPIIPNQWLVKPAPKVAKQIKTINSLLKKCDRCVNAADPDREGEEIFRFIVEQAGYKGPIDRIWCSGYDKVSIQRSLDKRVSGTKTIGYANAARARARADWMIGMNLSRAYTLSSKNAGVVTVGRVQTPTLKLIVDRDREIENFVSQKHYLINLELEHENGSFSASLKYKDDLEHVDAHGRLLDAVAAKTICQALNGQEHSLTEVKKESKSQPPPLPLSQIDIGKIAAKKYGYTAKQVLDICQTLYEKHKATTYPRTDCSYLPESQQADVPAVIETICKTNPDMAKAADNADITIPSRSFNDKRISAHHAIIPTMNVAKYELFSQQEKNIYDIIALYYIAQFYPKYEYAETSVKIDTDYGVIRASSKIEKAKGWKVLLPDSDKEKAESSMPDMNQNDRVTVVESKVKPTNTKPPKHFLEGELGSVLANIHKYMPPSELTKVLKDGDGIGTSATRPGMIDDLKKRKFLKGKGKFIISTDLGRDLVDAVPEVVKSPILTALFERQLKQIESGDIDMQSFVDQQVSMVVEEVEVAKKLIRSTQRSEDKQYDFECPECSYGLDRRRNREKGSVFWACVNPKCRKTYSDTDGEPRIPKATVVN